MKKSIRIIIPLILVLAIVVCTGWYLLIYDQEFTRDALLHTARYFERNGNRTVSAWFYNCAYKQAGSNDAVAIELAEQYKESGNYTKAEYTLSNAIADGGGIDLYIALCKTYVEQDKLLDAVNMLNNVTNKTIKAQLEELRPALPVCTPDPNQSGAFYTQYITVSITAGDGTLYVSDDGEFPSVNDDVYDNKGITLKDGENILYAVAISDNGLVSPAAIFGFTVGGVIERVNLEDAAVEAEIRKLLEVDAEKVLYTNDLWTIKEFTLPDNAASLADLHYLAFLEKLTINSGVTGQLAAIGGLTNLKELSITDTAISAEELAVIGRLPNLTTAALRGCSLSTTAGLEFAVSLTHLDLSSNAIRNITPLSSLKKLQEVNLSHNALDALDALSSAEAIITLDVSYNDLSTIAPITSVVTLKKLVAGNNKLTEISGLQRLTALNELDLSNNTIADISPLASCTELTNLNLSGNAISDISALSKLNKLTDLNFSHNKVTKLPQWEKNCALVNIDGAYNQISTLEPLSGLRNLNNVFMDYNKEISSVKWLSDCPVLIQVNVYGTKVTQVGALTSQSVVVNYDPTQ